MSETEPHQTEPQSVLFASSLFELFPKNMPLEEEKEIRAKYDGTVNLGKSGVMGVKIIVDYARGLLIRANVYRLDSDELYRKYEPLDRNRWSWRIEDIPQGSPQQVRMDAIFDYVHQEWKKMKEQPPTVDLRTREWLVPKKDPLTIVLPSEPVQEVVIKPKRSRPKKVVINRARTVAQKSSLEAITRDEVDIWAKEEIGRMNIDRKSAGIEPEEI